MQLNETERLFQDGLIGASQAILPRVLGNAREDAATMFGVYRNAYWSRLVESLGVDFPGLKALAGGEGFDRLARAYIAKYPSVTPSIRWAGRLLAEFLAAEAPFRDDGWLTDMARFDWALAHAFDAADAPAVGLSELTAIPPEFWGGIALALHPTMDLFPRTTPVEDLRSLLLADAATTFDRALRRDGALMVWRLGFELKYRAIDPAEFDALTAIRSGASFGDICELLAARMDANDAVMAAARMLRGWLEWGVVQDITHDAPISAA